MAAARPERLTFSINHLLELAAPRAQQLLMAANDRTDYGVREPGEESGRQFRYGVWHSLSLSDDLLLARCDYHSLPAHVIERQRCELDSRGWLYMHFRLDGISHEQGIDGKRCTLGADTFLLSASSHPTSLVRQLLGDSWRTVVVACRPDFLARTLTMPAAQLPNELRRFQSGDAEVDFWHAGQLSIEMKSAARHLLYPTVQPSVRDVYLRAKAVELVCLALDGLSDSMDRSGTQDVVLSSRDVACLQTARLLLQDTDTQLSLAELARRVGLNRSKLALGFRQVFGTSIGAYHRELRLELARRMLERPGTRISSAAAAAGYNDLGSFTKAFKRQYGSLPSALKAGRALAPANLRRHQSE